MITAKKSQNIVFFYFINWMLFTSVYSWFILGLKHPTLTFIANSSFFTNNEESKLFQRERGGVRRVGVNSGKNITKGTLSKLV